MSGHIKPLVEKYPPVFRVSFWHGSLQSLLSKKKKKKKKKSKSWFNRSCSTAVLTKDHLMGMTKLLLLLSLTSILQRIILNAIFERLNIALLKNKCPDGPIFPCNSFFGTLAKNFCF